MTVHPLWWCARHAPIIWLGLVVLAAFLADWLTGNI